jgi:hypothetical protein
MSDRTPDPDDMNPRGSKTFPDRCLQFIRFLRALMLGG